MVIPDFSSAKVLVVGDVMLDRYWHGGTGRISPEAPVPIVNVQNVEDRPGGAANVALNAAALGAKVSMLGLVGNDENVAILKDKLESYNIDTHFLALDGFSTITKLRVLSRNQQLLRMDFEKSFEAVDKTPLEEQFSALLAHINVVVLSDYNKGTLSSVQTLIALAKERNVPVIVDPKGNSFTKYRGASLLTPNVAELLGVVGDVADEIDLLEKASDLQTKLDLDSLLLTRSERGMSLFYNKDQVMHLPAKAKEVYDVTGAGDTVVSTIAASIGAGAKLDDACVLANYAASIVVGKVGTSSVSATELAVFALRQSTHIDGGVFSEEQLIQAVSAAKAKGEKIVMTNGCFDILHAGHVSYLTEAAVLGDRLIVAVNDDASVSALKGPGRPVNNVHRRMAVLAGLSSVHWVVPFKEDTPARLIEALLPDILVKGGDYKVHEIAGGEAVINNGGDVKVLNFEDGVSTTGIINQLVEQHKQ
ncbi:bifunctional D-glycero-beta-D-manno-heptose-7-phosphate kinase/D-glycero-beta-D-manno-heptose 1-phosphate adenylyltransferase HldE [Alteromonas sp. 5E99-2]|uniref:bifunctional D-glycero-beta-D-manno-heptose-7-phosphate kinase/D-glycero-beta-D-manno-heptose 1-phosphate adenylyltransferase HldE n=1 Tax=Alteromonas sp. 5E99-2 TaxID=2817683 RepID=UPI001A99C6BA|nr:bifunctional D-glycero-beta-D-manno-heptose-7-phosphate kinase/D-glycero-beta-D-manno-heptose 1-phosphate adenylyltransferase HldE [Alteromonas sp. 5E99-2]MBO1256555.1 bifunctional D-glycero-beta-D-manno-heptose-7-phosphate kinase/D-glycero-beta-D-manno-heptose 1-phosphate adenylyltransferase HldE [Alteromonas sp. 5E99-2]